VHCARIRPWGGKRKRSDSLLQSILVYCPLLQVLGFGGIEDERSAVSSWILSASRACGIARFVRES
jgi:hypothetical protein